MADEKQFEEIQQEEEFIISDEVIAEEAVRIQLSALAEELTAKGVGSSVIYDENDGYILLVPVHGPENMSIAFSMDADDDYNMTMFALYRSAILNDPVITSMDFPEVPDYEDIAENFILRLAKDCFIWEHEAISRITPVNDQNAEDFLDYLPDYFFGDEPYYACGISLRDKGRFIPCGAAVFSYTKNGMAINNVLIEEDCRGIGLGTYLADYVIKNYSEVEN